MKRVVPLGVPTFVQKLVWVPQAHGDWLFPDPHLASCSPGCLLSMGPSILCNSSDSLLDEWRFKLGFPGPSNKNKFNLVQNTVTDQVSLTASP